MGPCRGRTRRVLGLQQRGGGRDEEDEKHGGKEEGEELSLISRLHQQQQAELAAQQGETRELSEGDKVREQMLRRALGLGREGESEADPTTTTTIAGDAGADEGPAAMGEEDEAAAAPMQARVLPHAMPSALRVFSPCPDNTRLIVVATNIAETSITIPGIRYVVDCGRAKTKTVDPATGVSQFRVQWISKASSEQRKGRAGRTGPGHVYRLYSSALFHNYLPQFSPPEILTTSLEELVLQMKSMGIEKVHSFPFPTPPPPSALQAAVTLLENLGAVSSATTSITARSNAAMRWLMQDGENDKKEGVRRPADPAVTSLGKLLASFSLSPRYAKMIVAAHAASTRSSGGDEDTLPLLSMTLSMIAMLGGKSPFVSMAEGAAGGKGKNKRKKKGNDDSSEDGSDNGGDAEEEEGQGTGAKNTAPLWSHPKGDAIARLRALGALSFALHNQPTGRHNDKDKDKALRTFCSQNQLNAVVMTDALELRAQLQRQCDKLYGSSSSSGGGGGGGCLGPDG